MLPGTTPDAVPWANDLITGLCEEQLRRGHRVQVVATSRDRTRVREESERGPTHIGTVPVSHFAVDRWVDAQPVGVIRRFNISSALVAELKRSIRAFDIVHIHFIFPFSSVAAASISRAARVPYIISLNGNLDPILHAKSRHFKDLYLGLLGYRALNGASALHFMSEGERRTAKPFALASPEVVINYGIDAAKYRPEPGSGGLRARYGLSSKKIVLYLGRIARSKGLDLLVEAFRGVAERDPDIHLLLVGPDDSGYSATLQDIVSGFGLQQRVTMTGRLPEEDKLAAYSNAEVFVLPSYTEAFGLAMLEAMACGVPALTTERAALASELAAADAALVVPSDAASVSRGLTRLLEDRMLRERLRVAGRQLVIDRFSWEGVTDRFLALYESILVAAPTGVPGRLGAGPH